MDNLRSEFTERSELVLDLGVPESDGGAVVDSAIPVARRAPGIDTRRRIVAVALELFATKGYAGTSIRDIAEPMGMTKAALYYHFSSKEQILEAVTEPMRSEMDLLVRRAATPPLLGPTELLRAMVDMLSRNALLIQTLFNDPSSIHRGHHEDARDKFRTLVPLLARSDDHLDLVRARCAIGVVQVGVLGTLRSDPRYLEPPRGDTLRLLSGQEHVLEEDVRAEIVAAALRVLDAPER